MSPNSGDDIIVRADKTDVRMGEDAGAVVRSLVRGLQHQRMVSKWLIASICLDVMLTFGFAYVMTKSAAQEAEVNRNSTATALSLVQQNTSCESGNVFRKNERYLWDQILSLPPQPGLTVLQLKAREESAQKVKGFLDVAFKLRICPSATPVDHGR